MTLHDVSSDATRVAASQLPLTDRAIRALPFAQRKQYAVRDAQIRWLALRVSRASKSWVYLGRIGRATRTKIGEYPTMSLAAARVEALRWRQLVVQGMNPRRPRAAVHSFVDVANDYIASMGRRHLRQSYTVEYEIRRRFIPLWGHHNISAITRADICDMVQDVVEQGHNALAHHAFSYASRLFAYAVERGLIDASPCERIKPVRLIGPRPLRLRVLSDSEIKAVWGVSIPLWSPLVRMLLLTGARRGEVAGARWSEMSADTWVVPPERHKMNAAHVVPIVPALRSLLDQLPRWHGCDYVFSANGHAPVTGFTNGKRMIDCASGVTGWTMHDLRRTMRTHLSALPVSDLVRELVIGHARPGLHRVYDQHSYVAEKRHALELWSERLLKIVG